MSESDRTLEDEVERLATRLQQLESHESTTITSSHHTTQSQIMVPRAKPDTFSGTETTFDNWLKHFELCANINGWTEVQSRQQLAVQLRGRAQRVYTASLHNQELQSYASLVSALRAALDPPQQRAIHKLAFRNRQRKKQENLVDLATDLRHLATRAFPDHDGKMVEEELLEQFINALDSRELRLGVSQTSPKNLDDAVHTSLRLETLFAVEKAKTFQEANMATTSRGVNEVTTPAGVQPQPTTEVNSAGAGALAPRWAREIMARQDNIERLLGRGIQDQPRQNRRSDECYHCGKPGHFQRNCPERLPRRREYQGNGNRAGSNRW